ncbi:MAG: glycerophosphodiester phosphodiesterase family protein [Rhodovibrionaceae bacterium]|nr:glycerophosphodiester phosphodiesterase family protein [Rhodovibrionaceae bacterium]
MSIELPPYLGHRGAAASAPENTLAGLEKAAELGAPGVEFDVMLSADGVPVLHHDNTLSRTAGREAAMAETPWAELRRLDAGAWYSEAFAGQRVPRLTEAIAVVDARRLFTNLEIKATPGRDVEAARVVVATLARAWPKDLPLLVSSFSVLSLAACAALDPDLHLGLLADELPENWRTVAAALGCATIHLNEIGLTAETVSVVRQAGYGVAVFTVNDPDRARELRSWGAQCIITDVPEKIAAAI